ncbi:MAG TPA: hypothetical protein VM054_00880, partial [bacterium]|nr:hypothetical protein [bacterium]
MAIRRHETHEQTINTAMAEVLRGLGHDWDVKGERIGDVFEGGGRLDIFLSEPGGSPVVIEAEVNNYLQAETEACSRLGRRFAENGRIVDTVIALVYPEELRSFDGEALRNAIRTAIFEYSVFTQEFLGDIVRVPSSGWLSSGIVELALLLHRSRVPSWRVEPLADTLERGIVFAAGLFSDTHPHGSKLASDICKVLDQNDDESGQARRMVMSVITNALIFQASLAETETQITDTRTQTRRTIKSPSEFRENGAFLPTPLVDEWNAILKVNYWPIFFTAGKIIRLLPTATSVAVLSALWETAESLIAGGVTKSHDL